MEWIGCEWAKSREASRRDEVRHLAEYARHIYMMQPATFTERAGGLLHELTVTPYDVEFPVKLYIVLQQADEIRGASYVIDMYSAEEQRQCYEFTADGALQMRREYDGTYHEMSLAPDDSHESALYELRAVLEATGVAPPVTTPEDDATFWRLALRTCYDELEDETRQVLEASLETSAGSVTYEELAARAADQRTKLELGLTTQASWGELNARGATPSEVDSLYWTLLVRRATGD